jgi:hypothetical protein
MTVFALVVVTCAAASVVADADGSGFGECALTIPNTMVLPARRNARTQLTSTPRRSTCPRTRTTSFSASSASEGISMTIVAVFVVVLLAACSAGPPPCPIEAMCWHTGDPDRPCVPAAELCGR